MKKLSIAFVAGVNLSLVTTVAAADSRNLQARQKAVAKKQYANAGLDLDATSLPANFSGHDCNKIASRLKSLNPEKSEFETSDAYAIRMEKALATPLYAQVNAWDALSFIPEIKPFLIAKYDADTKIMSVTIYNSYQKATVAGKLANAVAVNSTITSSRSYTAENSFGRKVTVNRTDSSSCAFAFFDSLFPKLSDEVQFEVEPDQAKLVKENLTILYIGAISAPYRSDYSLYKKPTVDSPTELVGDGDSVVMRLAARWLVDPTSGAIYAKLSP
jgi:hypothetical protein